MHDKAAGIKKSGFKPWLLPLMGALLVIIANVTLDVARGNDPLSFFQVTVRGSSGLYGTIITILNNGTETVLLALGMTLVMACSGGADLSAGALMALSGSLCFALLTGSQLGNVRTPDDLAMPVFVGVLAGIALAGLCGAFNGLLVGRWKLPPTLATLLLFTGGRSIAQLLHNNNSYIRVDAFNVIGGRLGIFPTPVLIAAGCILLVTFLVRVTPFGKRVERTGEAPREAGKGAAPVILACFVLCGLLSGAAGIVNVSRMSVANPNSIGLYLEADAILAVLLGGHDLRGGRFSLARSVVGAYTVQGLTIFCYTLALPSMFVLAVKGALLILLYAVQSPGVRALIADRKARRENAPQAERS